MARLDEYLAKLVARPDRSVELSDLAPTSPDPHPLTGRVTPILGTNSGKTGQSQLFIPNIKDVTPDDRFGSVREAYENVKRHEIGHRQVNNIQRLSFAGDKEATKFINEVVPIARRIPGDPLENVARSLEVGLNNKGIKKLPIQGLKDIANKFRTLMKNNPRIFKYAFGLAGLAPLTKALGPLGTGANILTEIEELRKNPQGLLPRVLAERGIGAGF